MKQLFVFWQFNGSNECYCQLHCPECYGKDMRTFQHYWNGDVDGWEQAFMRLDAQHGNGGIYFVFSYGEALLSNGFFECLEMITKHPTWMLNVITNLLAPDDIIIRLVNSKLAHDKRLFMNPCWHPEGVDNVEKSWVDFKRHLLMLKAEGIPTHVMMVWFPPVIKDFPKYFEWLDSWDFRVGVRRFINESKLTQIPGARRIPLLAARSKLSKYSRAERGYLYAYTCPKVTAYGLELESTRGKQCWSGRDMILVKYDGAVSWCACCSGKKFEFGNVFDPEFKLKGKPVKCGTNVCGGDFGMLVLPDKRFGPLPESLPRDTFLSIVEGVPQSSPVAYHNRIEMLKWVEELKREQSQS